MGSITFSVVPPVEALKSDVDYFRIAEYKGKEGMGPNGLPGIVFQHSNGQSAMMPNEFAAEDLNTQLIMAKSSQDCIRLFSLFLLDKLKQTHARDPLIEESLHFIHANISSITVKSLLAHLHLSERQFEKRFVQTVGVSEIKRSIPLVRKLKDEEGSDMLIMGSGSIVQQLANEGLIDEYLFIVTPVVAGEGKFLFEHVKQFSLSLIETKFFKSGNIVLHYAVNK